MIINYRYLKSIINNFVIIFFVTSTAIYFQNVVIYPIEKIIFKSSAIDYVSIFFIPHGIKIILFFIYRYNSIFPIFLATYLYEYNMLTSISHLAGSFIGIAAISLSFLIISYLMRPVLILDSLKFPIWRLLLVVTFISSLMNASLQSMIASFTFKDFNLNILFLIGDILGSTVMISLLIILRKQILRLNIYEK